MFTSPNKPTRQDCALCLQIEKLRHSHIVPEFFYRRIYDQSPQRFHVISTDKNVTEDFGQKGYREYLLCESCEGKTGRWDYYASQVFYRRQHRQPEMGNRSIRFPEVSYKEFKLFLMSLLWRMQSAEGTLFSRIDLGQKHSERVRSALLIDDPLSPDDYPCFITAVMDDGQFCEDWLLQPEAARADGYRWYHLLVGGYLFSYAVASHPLPRGFSEYSLTLSNELTVRIREIRDIPFLHKTMSRFGEAQRARSSREQIRGVSEAPKKVL